MTPTGRAGRLPSPAPGATLDDMSSYGRIYEVVQRIPAGRVSTYGQVAQEAGLPGHARQAGYAMAAVPEGSDVPWHRVINARGEVSRRAGGSVFERIQRMLLEAEGVHFDADGRVDLERFGWDPRVRTDGMARRGDS